MVRINLSTVGSLPGEPSAPPASPRAKSATDHVAQHALSQQSNTAEGAYHSANRENGCWYIDWTSHMETGDFKFPEPQANMNNTINIFVGTLNDQNGEIGGFGTLTNDRIPDFVRQAKDKGFQKVKISIGGCGGAYDNTWDSLTEGNYKQEANKLAQFCIEHDLDGVDFDYEEWKPEQEALVGKFIKAFNEVGAQNNKRFDISICTNASFNGWKDHVQRILDPTKNDAGESCVDRLYVMAYFNSLEDEEAWLNDWAGWIKDEFNMGPERLGVGYDDFDAHVYDPEDMKAFAAKHGYSISHWAYDPTRNAQAYVVDRNRVKINPGIFERIWNCVLRILGIAQSRKLPEADSCTMRGRNQPSPVQSPAQKHPKSLHPHLS